MWREEEEAAPQNLNRLSTIQEQHGEDEEAAVSRADAPSAPAKPA